MDLSGRCISARKAVETLDAAFFRHSDGLSWPQATRPTGPALPQPMSQSDGLEGTNEQGMGQKEKQTDATASIEQNFHVNDIMGCLQQGYESLDGMVTNATSTL